MSSKSSPCKRNASLEPIPIQYIQREIQRRLNSMEMSSSLGCQDQRSYLQDILSRSISLGESNSVILVGPRGSGKSALVNSLLQEIHSEEMLQVNLNGFLQTDDKIAIKEIARQLKLENSVEDKVFGSFADNFAFLLEALSSGNQGTKVICCVIDEFDLFCAHHNQALLYSLLDTSLQALTPIVVIGLTCRLDVLELLEKRVKSRFSHRTIYLFTNYTFDDYIGLLLNLLTLSPCENGRWDPRSLDHWNNKVKELQRGTYFQCTVKKMFNLTKDILTLKSFLFVLVSKLDDNHTLIMDNDFDVESNHFSQDSKKLIIQGLSVLEFCLVLAMQQLHMVYDGEPFNFEMIYKEYSKFSVSHSAYQLNKEVIIKAFEHLIALEIVQPIDGHSSRIQKGYRLVSYMLESSQVADALRNYSGLPTEVQQWSSTLAK